MFKAFLTLLILDLIFIQLVLKKRFGNMVMDIQKEPMSVNLIYAFMSYVFIFLTFYYFVIVKKATVKEAFLLGFFTYAIFDFTNLALFKNYSIQTALIDMIWGGTLFALTRMIV